MSAETANFNVDSVAARERVAGRVANLAGFEFCAVMQGDGVIGFGKMIVEPVAQHSARAINSFLGGLSQNHERAAPLIFQVSQHLRGAQHVRYVNVVTAGVHHADFLAGVVFRFHFARVRQAGFFINRQRVKLSTNQHSWAGAVFHNGDHAVTGPFGPFIFAEALGDGIAHRAQLRREKSGCFLLVMRELRRSVQRLVRGHQGCDVAIYQGVERLLGVAGSCGEQSEKEECKVSFSLH